MPLIAIYMHSNNSTPKQWLAFNALGAATEVQRMAGLNSLHVHGGTTNVNVGFATIHMTNGGTVGFYETLLGGVLAHGTREDGMLGQWVSVYTWRSQDIATYSYLYEGRYYRF